MISQFSSLLGSGLESTGQIKLASSAIVANVRDDFDPHSPSPGSFESIDDLVIVDVRRRNPKRLLRRIDHRKDALTQIDALWIVGPDSSVG